MKLKDIKNGSIYYNVKKNRPERVISNTFSSSRVVTEFHGKNQSAVSTRHIRLANSAEVEKYLDKTRKSNLITSFFGKLFAPKKVTAWGGWITFKRPALDCFTLVSHFPRFFCQSGRISWDSYTSPHNTNPRPTPRVFYVVSAWWSVT